MNIMQVNKFYHIVGGADRYFFEISELLIQRKHNIEFFSMKDRKNINNVSSKYFVHNRSYTDNNFRSYLFNYFNIFYSVESRKKIKYLCDRVNFDIAHIHAIYHQISPSVLLELKKRNIPIVQSLGDYHLIAPNYNLFHKGQICEITKPDVFYKAIFHKCVKDSLLYSFAEVIEKYFFHFTGWETELIDYFLPRSKFLRDKLIEYGINEKKIDYLPHFIDSNKYFPRYETGGYILYFGRLSPEKGLEYLIDAMRRLPKINLRIVGTGRGDYMMKLKKISNNQNNIRFYGFKDNSELKRIISWSRFTVLPSVWYEVFGLSILESFASGKPVVASNIGGIPETVKHRYNGLLFEPRNIDDLADKINYLWSNHNLCKTMGINARHYVEKNHNPSDHYEKLMKIYKKAIKMH